MNKDSFGPIIAVAGIFMILFNIAPILGFFFVVVGLIMSAEI
jgi:hypothetical protein